MSNTEEKPKKILVPPNIEQDCTILVQIDPEDPTDFTGVTGAIGRLEVDETGGKWVIIALIFMELSHMQPNLHSLTGLEREFVSGSLLPRTNSIGSLSTQRKRELQG